MAWEAELVSAVAKPEGSLNILAEVRFYDTADEPTTLHSQVFEFKPATTSGQMQTEIQRVGALARSAHTKAASLNATFPVGSTITVP